MTPGDGYPEHLLAREAASAYEGEGPFALWHFSEDPSLGRFEPRPTADPGKPPLVWAVDTRHSPMFWFPRDCPRGCVWPVSTTTAADRERFFGQGGAGRVHVIEGGWLDRVRACRLYAYRLPTDAFSPHEKVGGYWVTERPVTAAERVTVGDLLGRHAAAGIELRVAPSIWPFWRRVTASTVEYSGSRLRNAADHPERVSLLPRRALPRDSRVVVTGMKRWLALAGVMAVAALTACSSPSGLAPSGQAPLTAASADPHTGTPGGQPNETPAGPHTATLDAAGRPDATLEVLTGTAELRIGTADFGAGGALLRVSTPDGDPPPYLREGTAEPGQDTVVDLSAPGASQVTVTLNAAVRWRLALGGGTTRTIADLRGARVTGIAFTAGSSVISVALPRPGGRVPVQLAGGASQFLLSLPNGVPARVTAGGGAGEVSLDGQDHVGVAGGSVFTTPGWAGSTAGFDIDATAGAARVAVTARSS